MCAVVITSLSKKPGTSCMWGSFNFVQTASKSSRLWWEWGSYCLSGRSPTGRPCFPSSEQRCVWLVSYLLSPTAFSPTSSPSEKVHKSVVASPIFASHAPFWSGKCSCRLSWGMRWDDRSALCRQVFSLCSGLPAQTHTDPVQAVTLWYVAQFPFFCPIINPFPQSERPWESETIGHFRIFWN